MGQWRRWLAGFVRGGLGRHCPLEPPQKLLVQGQGRWPEEQRPPLQESPWWGNKGGPETPEDTPSSPHSSCVHQAVALTCGPNSCPKAHQQPQRCPGQRNDPNPLAHNCRGLCCPDSS